MCGISGFFNPYSAKLPETILQDFGRVLHHRGPDAFNYYYRGNIGLAHNRLSLLDLSEQGNQPFENEQGVLIYNGEIYNYLELKKQYLEDRNIAFRSTSDTEVLFYLLQYEGIEKTLSLIKGMFAFAYFDKKRDQLYLCRDRIGIKPLFYSLTADGTLYFSSEIKALLSVVELKIDKIRALYSVAGILDKGRDYSIFENVKHAMPGHFIQYSAPNFTSQCFFKLSDYVDATLYQKLEISTPHQVIETFQDTFQKVIQGMLMSDAPMGAFVSGGIDSSLISAIATRQQPIQLFTANVVGKFSEVQDARRLSSQLNTPLTEYAFQPEYFLRDLVQCTWHMETPIIMHTSAVPFSGVAKLARANNVKAVLTGEGSDELFLGYPRLLTKRYDRLIRGPLELLNWLYNAVPGLKRYVLKHTETQVASTLELLTQKYQRQILRQEELEYLEHIPAKERADSYLSFQMMYEGIVALLWRNDRMGMMHSIEARFPYLGEEIIKLALNLPIKYKIGSTSKFYNYKHPFLIDKWIIRQTAQRYIDSSLSHKVKNGFPMYGYNHLKIDGQLFQDGFIQELLDLNRQQMTYFAAHTDKYILAKFLALEIWGKLFVYKQDIPNMEQQLQAYVTLNTGRSVNLPKGKVA